MNQVALHPTAGLLMGAMWVAVGAALVTGAGAGVALALACLSMLGLRPQRLGHVRGHIVPESPSVQEQMDCRVEVQLENTRRTRAPVQWTLADSVLVESSPATGFEALGPRATMTQEIRSQFLLFGRRKIGPLQAIHDDVLGTSTTRRILDAGADVRVVPAHPTFRDGLLRNRQIRATLGAYEVQQPGTGMDFFGLREYQPGDRPRDINWKATARGGAVIVNQFQRESTNTPWIFIDGAITTLLGKASNSPYARGARLGLAVAATHIALRDEVHVVLVDDPPIVPMATGARRLPALIDAVAQHEPQRTISLEQIIRDHIPELPRHAPVMVITPDPSTLVAVAGLLMVQGSPLTVVSPVPDWPDPSQQQRDWLRRQEAGIERLRGAGVQAIALPADTDLTQVPLLLEPVS
ncbi:MAG: DUF58 domain-containing protein [Thermoplasmatota archaeon]